MAVFSTNQVRHLYAAKAFKTDTVANVGDIKVGGDTDTVYFEYQGHGGRMRSDLIKVDSVVWAKHSTAATQKRALKKVTVALNPDYLVTTENGDCVIPGQDYILRIVIRQFAGMSDEDTYVKYGAVHGVRGMTTAQFYEEMVNSLTKNFKREATDLLTFTKTDNGIVIEEVEQDWILGIKSLVPVYFDVYPTTVIYDGDEVVWGTVTEGESTTKIPNSKQLADLEYFCMGERGDIYRQVSWPNYIPTKYILDGEDADGYDVLDIHYYYEGGGENPQKSEKDITIVAKAAVIGTSTTGIIKALKDKGITVTEPK